MVTQMEFQQYFCGAQTKLPALRLLQHWLADDGSSHVDRIHTDRCNDRYVSMASYLLHLFIWHGRQPLGWREQMSKPLSPVNCPLHVYTAAHRPPLDKRSCQIFHTQVKQHVQCAIRSVTECLLQRFTATSNGVRIMKTSRHFPKLRAVLFSDGTCQYSELSPLSCCGQMFEHQLNACSLSASIRHAYWHLFVSKQAPVMSNGTVPPFLTHTGQLLSFFVLSCISVYCSPPFNWSLFHAQDRMADSQMHLPGICYYCIHNC